MKLEELIQALKEVKPKQLEHLKELINSHREIILIGNGGSNAIASHMAVDYTKFLGKKCFVPNASDLMTMIVNDYGVEDMYAKFIEYHYSSESLAILISSSGNSRNILKAAYSCFELKVPTVILTGFSETNLLNSMMLTNIMQRFHVNSINYGVVEMAHHSILHSVV